MKKNNCDLFFSVLANLWKEPVRVLVFGGAAAQILGGKRPTRDVDFEVLMTRGFSKWEKFNEVIEKTENITGLKGEFYEKIQKCSQISYLDYKKHRRPYKNFGSIIVEVLQPTYWSIGKISRYWDSDVQDMIAVFKNQKANPLHLAKLWKKALEQSGHSSELGIVKKHPVHFFETYGKEIWGKSFPEGEVKKIGF